MNHKIISFYKIGLDEKIIKLQKNVFDKFDIPLKQVGFESNHSDAIENFLENNYWDSISILDVDLIPLSKDVFKKAEEFINDRPLIYGNAQASNSSAYVAPSFINFTKYTYNKIGFKDFGGGTYEDKEIDVAEKFSIIAKQKNIELMFSLPLKSIIPLWYCRAGSIHFDFGIGTFYDNDTFHCFEIRKPDRYNIFVNECNKILNCNAK
jgi:hypothetical protein